MHPEGMNNRPAMLWVVLAAIAAKLYSVGVLLTDGGRDGGRRHAIR